jgi:hypothetical protein
MRYVFGTIALLAATVLVVISATTLFISAFTASVEPWQQWTNGTGTAAIVAWEACALTLIGMAWYRGYKPVAILSTLLLVTAAAVTLKWEMRATVVGQADKMAERALDARHMSGLEEDLAWARDQRKKLTARKDLDWINNRIEALEKQRSGTKAVAEIMPEASIAARITGHSEQGWRDFWMVIPLLFWTLARIVAFPLAIVGLISFAPARRQEPQEASKESPASTVPETPSSPATELVREPQADPIVAQVEKVASMPIPVGLERIISPTPPDDFPRGGKKPEAPQSKSEAKADILPSPKVGQRVEAAYFEDDNVHYLPKRGKKKAAKRTEGSVLRWKADRTSETPDKSIAAEAAFAYANYLDWCEEKLVHPVRQNKFSRILSAAMRDPGQKGRPPRNGRGTKFPRLLVPEIPSAEPMRKRA